MVAGSGANAGGRAGTRPNVLIVLIDALRADRVVGDDRSCRTPFLDRLRKRSTVFTRAFSTASTTPISVASMLTGTYPYTHGVHSLINCRLRRDLPTLPEAFRAAGYRTWAEMTGPLLALTDMDRGFDEYRCRPSTEWLDTEFRSVVEKRVNAEGPWFGFLHLFEVHHPRRVAPGFGEAEYGRTSYDRAVSSVDAQLSAVLSDLPDDTILIVTSDHGEHVSANEGDAMRRLKRAFRVVKRVVPGAKRLRRSTPKVFRAVGQVRGGGDTLFLDWMGHGYHVYDYLTNVPLIIRASGLPAGREVAQLASHVDLLPTLAALCDLPLDASAPHHGMDLTPAAATDGSRQDRSLFMEAVGMKTEAGPEQRVFGLRTERFKYAARLLADDHREELYDLDVDPDERMNIAASLPEQAAKMKAELLAMMGEQSGEGTAPAYSEDERAQVEARLRDLGYLD